MRRVEKKSDIEVAREWDQVAHIRTAQIESGRDVSFHHVLLPLINELSADTNLEVVLDVGCGAGFITGHFGSRSGHVVGVDLSAENIKLARLRLAQFKNVGLVNSSVQDLAAKEEPSSFTLAIANMTLMTAVSLDSLMAAVARILGPNAYFIFTLTHPWFWPVYWGYSNEPWFKYEEEIFIEAPFKTSTETLNSITTHVHRPMSRYVNALNSAGFSLIAMAEPIPNAAVQRLYPEPWQFPRFLAVKARKST